MDDLIDRNGRTTAVPQIGEDGVVQSFVGLGIAEDSVAHAAVEGVQNAGGGDKIHVRHPERIEFRAAVVFDAAGPSADNRGVEIEFHAGAFLRGQPVSFKYQN